MYSHILLEVYCSKEWHEENKDINNICYSSELIPSYECLANNCPYAAFTSCENTLCYIGRQSVAHKVISLGEDMEKPISSNCNINGIDLWEEVATEQIDKAYSEFEEKFNNLTGQ